ncbi:MAG TPA: hypothetical protein ENK49_12355 [Gammaproteobacteria bacterium]|nr:hypothetical protein [Gammaproteobacteria bacterium]
MKHQLGILALLAAVTTINLAACTSAEERAAEAQAEYTEEKTKTLQEYKACVDDAGSDEEDLKKCEGLLKAIDAMESK